MRTPVPTGHSIASRPILKLMAFELCLASPTHPDSPNRQRWGVTNPLSVAGPTDADLKLNALFVEELKVEHVYEDKDEAVPQPYRAPQGAKRRPRHCCPP